MGRVTSAQTTTLDFQIEYEEPISMPNGTIHASFVVHNFGVGVKIAYCKVTEKNYYTVNMLQTNVAKGTIDINLQ